MSRLLVIATVIGAAFGIHVAAAAACGAGTYYEPGFEKELIVVDGQKAQVHITFNSGSYGGNGSHVSGWVGVENDDIYAKHWLQAGLTYEAGIGKALYIEYQTDAGYSLTQEGYFIIGNSYQAWVEKVSAGNWDAVIGQHSENNISISGMKRTTLVGESYTGTSTCNGMDYSFDNASPYGPSNYDFEMSPQGPYSVSNVTSDGWESSGP